MKHILFHIFLIGLISCSTKSQDKKVTDKEPTDGFHVETQINERPKGYRKIVISENTLDSFPIPFPEKNMLMPLRNYYKPYLVEAGIGEQDGPNFTYIGILKDNHDPIAYLNFNYDNEFKLEDIRIVSETAIDQYGVRVGTTLSELINARDTGVIDFDPYHFHIYYSYENSNIFYELEGELHTPGVENVEDIVLTHDDIASHTIQSIIWRSRE